MLVTIFFLILHNRCVRRIPSYCFRDHFNGYKLFYRAVGACTDSVEILIKNF